MADTIKLNVGGTIFETTLQTIAPSKYLVALTSGSYKENKNKPIFIDRDPNIFKHALRLLRDPTYPFPTKFMGELYFLCIDVNIDESEPFEFRNLFTESTKSYRDAFLRTSDPQPEIQNMSSSYGQGAIINNIARGEINDICDKLYRLPPQCSNAMWYCRPLPGQNYPCNNYCITISRHADTMTGFKIVFKLKNNNFNIKELKCNLVSNISLCVNNVTYFNLSGENSAIINELLMSPNLSKYRDDITIKNSEYTLHIPLILDGELSLSAMPFEEKKIHIECGSSYDLVTDVKVVVNGNMYSDTSDREKIYKGHPLYSFMTFSENEAIHIPGSSLPLKGSHLVNGLILYAKDRNTGKYDRIKCVTINIFNIIAKQLDECSILEEMAMIGMSPRYPVYYISFGKVGWNFSRISEKFISVDFYNSNDHDLTVVCCERNIMSEENGSSGLIFLE
uniref:BTB/POZ domain protein n=1 Tax=Marseillevirus LCMAC102 TaxID=2506603 RepID=A0A481YTW5_9VIRU|nr:MAG: BTB/POZ domain protein [Marseillevirus LCMAC102]